MAEGLLSEILAVERTIHKRLSDLTLELQTAQESLRAALAAEEQAERARCDAECTAAIETACAVARSESDALLAAATAYAARIESLADEDLLPFVRRYLAVICPEKEHDCPDAQT